MHDLRIAIFDHVLAQRAAFFDRIPVGRLMTRMTNDIESLNEMFAQGAITHARRFSWDRTAQRLLAVYRDAVTEHRSRVAELVAAR